MSWVGCWASSGVLGSPAQPGAPCLTPSPAHPPACLPVSPRRQRALEKKLQREAQRIRRLEAAEAAAAGGGKGGKSG